MTQAIRIFGAADIEAAVKARDAEWRAAVERVRSSDCLPLNGALYDAWVRHRNGEGFNAALDALLAAMEAK